MNTKRQTVWLVSMLSLMVVLSAYYLFTEDLGSLDPVQQASGTEIRVDTTVEGISGPEAGAHGAAAAGGASSGSQPSGQAATATGSKSDEDVLKEAAVKATSGNGYFASLTMKRNEEFAKQMEQWLQISVDDKKTSDEVEKALAELHKLQDQDEKVTSIEDSLAATYRNAVVLQESGKWKVVVQAAKLEKSEGVSIVDLVMKELGVTPDKVTIQYLQ